MSDRLAKAAEAQRLRDEGLLLREIAERMDAKLKTVHSWLTDPDGSKLRARKDGYRGKCVDCGARTDGSNGPAQAAIRCQSCRWQYQHDERRWTPEAIVEALQAWAAEHGHPPFARDWDLAGDDHPSETTVHNECGCWNAALRLAGFEPTREFNRPFAADPTVLDRVVALYREGHTTYEIAPMFGVSPTRVHQWLVKAGEPRRTPAESRRLREQREQVAA
jgi:transposase